MSFKTLLIIKGVVCLTFGFLCLFFPGFLFALLGASLGPGGALLAREYGANMTGTLVLAWMARDLGHTSARNPILWYLLVYDGIGFVATTMAMLTGVLNALGWGIVAVYLFIALGSAYVLFLTGEESGK